MDLTFARAKKPRMFFLYAMAPEGFYPAEANRIINAFIGRKDVPLCVYHDHFLGQPGGLAVFDVKDLTEVDGLIAAAGDLNGWRVDLRPLVFSHNPAAFDEQIAYTLSSYGGTDWNMLKQENRPVYADPRIEAETASDG